MIQTKVLFGFFIVLLGFVLIVKSEVPKCNSPGVSLPSSNQCKTYYTCDANKKPIEKTCPGNMNFNPSTLVSTCCSFEIY